MNHASKAKNMCNIEMIKIRCPECSKSITGKFKTDRNGRRFHPGCLARRVRRKARRTP